MAGRWGSIIFSVNIIMGEAPCGGCGEVATIVRTSLEHNLGGPLRPQDSYLLETFLLDVFDFKQRTRSEALPVLIIKELQVREEVEVVEGSKIA